MTLAIARSQNRQTTSRRNTSTPSKSQRRVTNKLSRRIANFQESVRTATPKIASGFHKPGSQNRNKH